MGRGNRGVGAALVLLGVTACAPTVEDPIVHDRGEHGWSSSSQERGDVSSHPDPVHAHHPHTHHPEEGSLGERLATMRTWDVCALHDIEAAERVTDDPANAIAPTDPIGKCSLTLGDSADRKGWVADIELKTMEARYEPENSVGNRVHGGPDIFREPQVQDSDSVFGMSCSFFYAWRDRLGVELNLHSRDRTPRDEVCDTAREYLVSVLPTWQDPPRVRDGLTTPRVSLYGRDPCHALQPAAEKYPQDEQGRPTAIRSTRSPYQCELRGRDSVAEPVVRVRYAGLEGVDEETEVLDTAGTPVYVDRDRNRGCAYRVLVDAPIAFATEDTDSPGRSPGVEIRGQECDDDLARRMVELVLEQNSLPEHHNEDAVVLGRIR